MSRLERIGDPLFWTPPADEHPRSRYTPVNYPSAVGERPRRSACDCMRDSKNTGSRRVAALYGVAYLTCKKARCIVSTVP